eukprot:EG_transcript_32444
MLRAARWRLGQGKGPGFGPAGMHEPDPLEQPSSYRAARAIQQWKAPTWIIVMGVPSLFIYFWYQWWRDDRMPQFQKQVRAEIESRGGIDPETRRYMESVQSKLNYSMRAAQLKMMEEELEKGKK